MIFLLSFSDYYYKCKYEIKHIIAPKIWRQYTLATVCTLGAGVAASTSAKALGVSFLINAYIVGIQRAEML